MDNVTEILEKKGHTVWSIGPDASAYDAIKLMGDKEIGVLVVLEESQLVGIISERDYLREVVLNKTSSKRPLVKMIMTTDVLCAQPDLTVDECMALMTEKRVRHLPVMDNEKLIGLISIGDLVKSTISEQEFMIGQLEYYVRTSVAINKWIAARTDTRTSAAPLGVGWKRLLCKLFNCKS
ncbi:MAG: CBS domain-containing protein [Gammaproteobacteria bacterium]